MIIAPVPKSEHYQENSEYRKSLAKSFRDRRESEFQRGGTRSTGTEREGRRGQPTTNVRKDMDEKRRSNTYQTDGVAQEPTYRRRPVFTRGNAVIDDQRRDTKNCGSRRRRRAED